ncbi:MAG: RusA family crossover junction endodeoxyribonuclease [bacterium]|nr:RusA family crossover junction endodeoxyribonuclease [bacterium]
MIELELPFPPSVNHYYRRVGPRTLISREGRAFRRKVCAVLAADGVRPLTGQLRIEIELYPPDRRRRDIDNVQKALLDALEHGSAYRDDSQIVKLEIEKGAPVRGGRTLVRIRKI